MAARREKWRLKSLSVVSRNSTDLSDETIDPPADPTNQFSAVSLASISSHNSFAGET